MALILPWAKKEALAGDRLPYRALIDENVVLLRDGAQGLEVRIGHGGGV